MTYTTTISDHSAANTATKNPTSSLADRIPDDSLLPKNTKSNSINGEIREFLHEIANEITNFPQLPSKETLLAESPLTDPVILGYLGRSAYALLVGVPSIAVVSLPLYSMFKDYQLKPFTKKYNDNVDQYFIDKNTMDRMPSSYPDNNLPLTSTSVKKTDELSNKITIETISENWFPDGSSNDLKRTESKQVLLSGDYALFENQMKTKEIATRTMLLPPENPLSTGQVQAMTEVKFHPADGAIGSGLEIPYSKDTTILIPLNNNATALAELDKYIFDDSKTSNSPDYNPLIKRKEINSPSLRNLTSDGTMWHISNNNKREEVSFKDITDMTMSDTRDIFLEFHQEPQLKGHPY